MGWCFRAPTPSRRPFDRTGRDARVQDYDEGLELGSIVEQAGLEGWSRTRWQRKAEGGGTAFRGKNGSVNMHRQL